MPGPERPQLLQPGEPPASRAARALDRHLISEPKGDFDAIVGNTLAKRELMAVAEALTVQPRRGVSRRVGGLVLAGPPGSGKTRLTMALAAAVEVPVYAISGWGVTALDLQLWYTALAGKPSLVIWDDGEPVIRRREQAGSLAPALSSALDQAEDRCGPMTVLVTTSDVHEWDVGLTRPGRLAPVVKLGLPGRLEREAMWRSCLAEVGASDDSAAELALWTEGLSGAGIRQAVDSALRLSRFDGLDAIDLDVLRHVIRRAGVVVAQAPPTAAQLNQLAVHAAGHAISAAVIWGPEAVSAVSMGLPYSMHPIAHFSDEFRIGRFPTDRGVREATCVALGGLVAEEQVFGRDQALSASSQDLREAEHLLGPIARRPSSALPEPDGGAIGQAFQRVRDELAGHGQHIVRLATELVIAEHGELSGPTLDECLSF